MVSVPEQCPCPPIVLRGVSLSYGSVRALDRVSLEVPARELMALVGPNGGGKSTLVRVALGLLPPGAGTAELFCQPAQRFREWRRVSYVAQGATSFDAAFPIRVRELVLLGRMPNRPMGRRFTPADHEAARWAMEVCGVSDLADRRMGDLSGGQKQRAVIAKALARKPELLIMDEPTAGVDAGSQSRILDLIERMNAELGLTVVIVTHDHGILRERVQRVVSLNGRVEFEGLPADFESWEHGPHATRIEAHQHHQHEHHQHLEEGSH
jgi:zinc transport system ATP-binding protein